MLYELACVGDLPLPQPSPTPSQKREREEEGSSPPSMAHTPSSTGSYGSPEAVPRSIAGSRRASHAIQQAHIQSHSHGYSTHRSMHSPASSASSHGHGHGHSHSHHHIANNFALPIYTEELGRIPIHPGINNSDPLVASGWHTGPQVPSMQGSAFTPHSTTPGGTAAMTSADAGIDPALESMFSMPPSMFDQMMNSFAGPVASSGAIPQSFGNVGVSGLVGGGMPMSAAAAAGPFPFPDALAYRHSRATRWALSRKFTSRSAPASCTFSGAGRRRTRTAGPGGRVAGAVTGMASERGEWVG